MAKSRKKRYSSRSKNRFFGFKKKSRKSRNPFRRRHHARNPMGQTWTDIAKLGGGAFIGGIGSGYLSQLALGANNTGIVGYASDTIGTLVIAWAANKFLGSKIAEGVIAGGIGAVVKRIWQDNVSGNTLSGYGNSDFLRAYGQRPFTLPTSTAGGSYQLQAAPGTPVTAASATAGAVGSGAVAGGVSSGQVQAGGRYKGRYGANAFS